MIRTSPLLRAVFFLLIDLLLSLSSLYLAYNLRFNFVLESKYMVHFSLVLAVLMSFKVLFFMLFRLYHLSWQFVSLHDAKKIVYAHTLAYLFFGLLYLSYPEPFTPLPRSVLIMDFILSILFIGLFRMAKRLVLEGQNHNAWTKTLMIGATAFGQTLLKEKNDFYISAIVDEDEALVGSDFSNKPIEKMEEIEAIIHRDKIVSVIITKVFDPVVLQQLYKRLNDAGIYDIRVIALEKQGKRLKKVTVEDLLARHPKDLDLETIEAFIKGKSVLITGAGGSIGSEIAKQCEKFGASSLVLVDQGEYNLYQISEVLPKAKAVLLDITKAARLEVLFEEVHPELVIHAAAYKHVPLCEANPDVAVINNVYGSKVLIDTSIKYGVKKVVLISTDKSIRPTNVMGATKRVVELYANNVNAKDTEISAVRFGNVLGSSGSVIPKFKAQIEQNQPITVTHPDITRYFMLISEACQLVLQAAAIAKGGELFILDMGEPVKIVDLAKQMIRLYGKEDEIEIVFTGLRPGEKLYEELLLNESEQRTKYSSIFIANPTHYDIKMLDKDIDALLKSEDKVASLQQIVPEFIRKV